METVRDFICLGSKITADGDCSHEIKRHLLVGRKAVTNPDSILKSKDFTDKSPCRQSCGFSSSHVWMDMRTGQKKKKGLSAKELMSSNCGAREDY